MTNFRTDGAPTPRFVYCSHLLQSGQRLGGTLELERLQIGAGMCQLQHDKQLVGAEHARMVVLGLAVLLEQLPLLDQLLGPAAAHAMHAQQLNEAGARVLRAVAQLAEACGDDDLRDDLREALLRLAVDGNVALDRYDLQDGGASVDLAHKNLAKDAFADLAAMLELTAGIRSELEDIVYTFRVLFL